MKMNLNSDIVCSLSCISKLSQYARICNETLLFVSYIYSTCQSFAA